MAAEDFFTIQNPEGLTQTLLERNQAGIVAGVYQLRSLAFRLDVAPGVVAYCPLGTVTQPAIPQVKAFAEALGATLLDHNEKSRVAFQKSLREGGRELGVMPTLSVIDAEKAEVNNAENIKTFLAAKTSVLGLFGARNQPPESHEAPGVAPSKKIP